MEHSTWKNANTEDHFKFLKSQGEMSTEFVATVASTMDAGLELLGESNEIVGVNESLHTMENITLGESWFGGNLSTVEGLNMSLNGTESDDNGPHYEPDELYDVPLSMIIFLSLVYGAISASALVGNTLVLWVVAVSRRMRTVTNMYIANLALSDIIIGLFTIPFQFQAALLQRWNLPDFMCAFCPFVQVLSVNVSVFTLSTIAVDRYRAVLYPLSARVSKRKACWAILSIWAIGFLLALPTELDYKVTQVPDKGGTKKPFCANLGLPVTLRIYYHQGIVVIQYFFPLIIISVAYIHMGLKLWGATAPGNKEESRDAVVLRNKKKVIKMLALVVLMFGVCWLPLQTYNFFQQIFPQINQFQYINVLWFASHCLAMSNSSVNPFIYAIYNDKFQREFQTRLRCLRRCFRHRDGDGNFSEGSDIDRSKIRAQYRFTNNRGISSTTMNTRSGGAYNYNNATSQSNIGDSTRCSMYNSRGNVTDNPVCSFQQCTLESLQAHQLNTRQPRRPHHHRHHHRRRRTRSSGTASGSSEASSSSGNNNSSSSFTNEIVTELECSSRINGDLKSRGTCNYLGSSFDNDTLQQETSLTVTNSPGTTTTAVAVVSAKGKAGTKQSHPIKTVTIVANNTNFKL